MYYMTTYIFKFTDSHKLKKMWTNFTYPLQWVLTKQIRVNCKVKWLKCCFGLRTGQKSGQNTPGGPLQAKIQKRTVMSIKVKIIIITVNS